MNRIQADEDTMARLLGVPVAQIPERVLVEYELRLWMYHSGGGSGALGLLPIIDMLRFLKLGRRPVNEQPAVVDWSLVPMDESVRVLAKIPGANGQPKEASGVYCGQLSSGRLAIRVDGDKWVREIPQQDVRIARDEPMRPVSPEDAVQSDAPLAEREPWVSMSNGELVIVEDGDELKQGHFQGVRDDEVLVVVDGDLTSRPFPPEKVGCEESRLVPTAEEEGEDAQSIHGADHD